VLSTHFNKENEVLSTETKSIRYMAKSMLLRLREAVGTQKGCWSADQQNSLTVLAVISDALRYTTEVTMLVLCQIVAQQCLKASEATHDYNLLLLKR